MHPSDFFPRVQAPLTDLADQARAFQNNLNKPTGSLAVLEDLGIWLSSCQGVVPPKKIQQPRLVIFAGDHGIAKRELSTYPTTASLALAESIRTGGAGVNALAAGSDIGIRVVDICLDHDAWGDERVSRSSGCIDVEDAMTEEQLLRAVEIGKRIADQEIDAGADLLLVGDLGVGGTTIAAALIGLMTNQEPVVVTGRGSGIDDEHWKHKVAVVRDAMFRARSDRGDVFALMRKISSPEIVAMAAFLAQAAVRRTPVLLDGVLSTAGAMLADKLAPGARKWMVAGHQSTEPAHSFALRYLGLTPLLDMHLRMGEGAGAAAAFPFITMAANIMNDMASLPAEPEHQEATEQ